MGVNVNEIPEIEIDCQARSVLAAMTEDFKNEEFRAGYEKWLAEQKVTA